MDLSCRPWSLNNFALSKVWFRCHTVDLRMIDITKVTSNVKSWLFQDQLEKPEEMILHRPIHMGGLGLQNVKMKAQASLIKTLMEKQPITIFTTLPCTAHSKIRGVFQFQIGEHF